MSSKVYTLVALLILAGSFVSRTREDVRMPNRIPSSPAQTSQTEIQYLLFQLADTFPELPLGTPATMYTKAQTEKAVDEIANAIGQVGDHVKTQLGFTTGPLMFDLTDDQLRSNIANAFAIAEEKNIAAAFHIDDSMFWNKRKDLWSDKNNVEWSDWQGTIVPHRIVGWVAGGDPVLAPPMCYNCSAIKAEATRIARDVIGAEIKKGIDRLNAIGKPYLFAGVIGGWETHLPYGMTANGSQNNLVFHALSNLGYRAQNPPADIVAAREGILADWIILWSKALGEAGIPKNKVYTHIAFAGDAAPTNPLPLPSTPTRVRDSVSMVVVRSIRSTKCSPSIPLLPGESRKAQT